MVRILPFIGVALFVIGCASTPRPAPLVQADIISMVKAGVTDEEIIRRIDATHTVFRLGSDDIVRLRNEGVSDRVVNYMLETWTRAAVYEQRRQDAYDDDFRFRYNMYYGHPWHRW